MVGGPIVTGGGLVFIAATMDNNFRALDIGTGEELWSAKLPAPGMAVPMTYEAGGRQYVVIAAGGNTLIGSALSDHLIAYVLPE
jgi:quinoprotein glucose dehydrogenase